MRSFFIFLAAAFLVITALPAMAVDDTNYGAQLNVVYVSPPNVHELVGWLSPVWSPDGKTIAFTNSSGYYIHTVPAEGGPPSIIYDNRGKKEGYIEFKGEKLGGGMMTLGFTPDGREIIYRDDIIDPARGGYIGPYDWPDGRHSDMAFINTIFVIKSVNIATGTTRTLVDEAQNAELSRDGRYLAYFWIASGEDRGKKRGVKILDLQTGENRMLVDDAANPSFTPDGKYVIFSMMTSTSNNLYRVPVTGGTPEQITFFTHNSDESPEGPIPNANDPKVSPDGKWILFKWSRWHPEIPAVVSYLGAYNLKTNESFKVFPNAEISIENVSWSPDGKKFCYQTTDRRYFDGFFYRIFISDFPPATYSIGTGIADALPSGFAITGNHPNPFNPSTTISYSLPRGGTASLAVYDITGRKVRDLAAGLMTAGAHSAVWNGRDASGRAVSSGVYFARLSLGGAAVTHRMTLMK